ncbi:MAG: carbamoyltransferase C-terminal domain-containing protein [Campylobacterales bacterium]
MKRRLNYQSFRPSILEGERGRLFEASFHHKYIAIAFRIKRKFWNQLPSAIHIDGTARPQFVTVEDNPSYYRLLQGVKRLTRFGVVINTSFNLHDRKLFGLQPIRLQILSIAISTPSTLKGSGSLADNSPFPLFPKSSKITPYFK